MTRSDMEDAKKTAAPMARDGRASITWKESKMQQQLTSDELLVVIEELAEFYGTPDRAPVLTPSLEGGWLAHMVVTLDFHGANVYPGPERAVMFARGETLQESILALHDTFVAAAPCFELVKGA
ncbi:hypothetical protein OED52_13890 [Rhodococcus sp. Z13]|uniref:Uncharacterized protein n=1 Tax=Rhodococcus sacchari TaxID=2962047 RepID=A0ACD4DCQ8_9NOCA|nr:hypothetical protein [Rhodococcus sp. Z13]UYP17763.1 hypothetical protein OED52_13890 [Rhodococcus sp. Z13]